MDQATVYTKTAKGITQVNQKSASLSKDLMKVLKLIDGKSNFSQIMEKAELDKNQLEKALNSLTKDGFARVFQTKKEESDPFGDDDFDFTAPGKLAPASTQRVIPGAANDISELVRQQEKAEADRKQKEQAHVAARDKAKVEAEARARAEAEAKARQQAEQQAMEQARKAKEASERARAELEAKKREEEVRRKALAEQQARLTAEQKAKEEAESRRLAELREKAEREAKALAEARARAEAEAEAMAKARAAAEEAVKRKAAEASNAEAQMKARLKEEIESRIRGEMEELLRNEVEGKDKTREQMRAEILAEAKMAAKAELEDRLREERENIARAEAEARSKAEKDATARAEVESKKRAEAEARAVAESQARMKAEEEANRLRAQVEEQARRAKGEAEARARVEAEAKSKLEAERQAKYEAEARAKIEAEEREKRERELSATIDAERKAKEEAEMRARIEAKARETIAEDTRAKVQAELESDLEKKAEIEGKAQAKAYMHAKAKAEQEEEEKQRKDQERRAREIADVLRTKVEADEDRPEGAPAKKRRPPMRLGKVVRPVIFGVLALLAIGIGVLHVAPLPAGKVEQSLAAWLQDEVRIESMSFMLVPTPHLKVTNVQVGKSFDATAEKGRLHVDLATIFGDRPAISAIELDNIAIGPEAVKRIPLWGKGDGKPAGHGPTRIALRAVKLNVRPDLASFDAVMEFTPQGAMTKATLNSSGGWSLVAVPRDGGFDLDATARNLALPTAVQIPLDARLKGRLAGNAIEVPEFEGTALEGQVNGSMRVTWASGVRLESQLVLQKVNAQKLVNAFTKDIAVVGKMDGNFNIVAEGANLETLFNTTRAQGKFKLGEGSISNVDLVAVMQSDSAGSRAGVTKFNELSGELSTVEKRANFRQVNLQGGVLRGNGAFEVGPNASLSGRLGLEIRSQVAQDRGSFAVSGTVSRPIIRRGG